jgi:hypothetical protein
LTSWPHLCRRCCWWAAMSLCVCCVVYLWTLDGSHRPAHAQTHTRLSVHIAARRRTRSKGVPLFVLSVTVVECRTHCHRRACSTECSPSSDPRPRHLWWFHGHTTQPMVLNPPSQLQAQRGRVHVWPDPQERLLHVVGKVCCCAQWPCKPAACCFAECTY